MARDDDPWRRIREREEEEENEGKDDGLGKRKPGAPLSGAPKTGPLPGVTPEGKLGQWMEQAAPLIDQVNALYSQFFAGVERMPPTERRKHLDQLMVQIQSVSKPTPALQFRVGTMVSQYISARDRWDRTMKDLESGKLKRFAGPKKP